MNIQTYLRERVRLLVSKNSKYWICIFLFFSLSLSLVYIVWCNHVLREKERKRDRAKGKNWKFVRSRTASIDTSIEFHSYFFCLSSLSLSLSLLLVVSSITYILPFFLLAWLACRRRFACVWCHELQQRVRSVFSSSSSSSTQSTIVWS